MMLNSVLMIYHLAEFLHVVLVAASGCILPFSRNRSLYIPASPNCEPVILHLCCYKAKLPVITTPVLEAI